MLQQLLIHPPSLNTLSPWPGPTSTFPVLQAFSDEELKAMVTAEAFEQYKADTMEETKLVVRASLLIDTIAKMEGVAVDKAEMEEQKVRVPSFR